MLINLVAMATASTTFATTDAWVRVERPTQCSVRRSFEADGRALTVRLSRMPESGDGVVELFVPASEHPRPNGKARLGFGGGEADVAVPFQARVDADSGQPVIGLPLTSAELGRAVAATSWTVSGVTRKPMELSNDGGAGVAALFDACGADMLSAWAIDPAAVAAVATRAVGAPGYFITNADYPKEAVAAGEQGTGIMLWQIGIDGRAHDCRMIQTTGSPSLDATSCVTMVERGRWATPALDRDGKPVPSWARRVMRWMLPGR
ncbi:energy transducer TonB [Sphingomonas flavalba]|uniref:energy transducer TonB n=1 Tax=Sphingomonas flavalba TaxID=2559804 RepID=UPI0039DF751C